jgi:putative endonuclease
MFYAYVIKSTSQEYFYKGHCKDISIRLQEHNMGKTKSNKHYAPFELVYFESFESEKEAISREKYFKTAAGRIFIKMRIASDSGSLPE